VALLSRLDRYLIREIAGPTLVGFVGYTGFMLIRGLVLFSDLVFQSPDPLGDTFRILGFSLPHIVVLTLPVAFLLGLLIAFGRLSADSEIVALRAAGVDLPRLYRPVGVLALAVTATTLFLIQEAVPSGNHQLSEMRLRLMTFAVAQRIAPGVFSPEFAGKSIYVEGAAPDRRSLTGLFVVDRSPEADGERLTLAPRGQLEIDEEEGRLWLRLEQATSHHVGADPRKYDVSFGTVRLLLQDTGGLHPGGVGRPREKLLREQRLGELLRTARVTAKSDVERRLAWVEIHKKFALPAAGLVFGLVGLPLGLATRRGGRAAGFAVSVVIVLCYYVLLAIGEARAIDGRLSPALAMWLPNLLLTLFGLLALRRVRLDRPLFPGIAGVFAGPGRRLGRPAPEESAPPAGARPEPPALRSPRFGHLLDRYVAGRFLRVFSLVLSSFVAVYVLIDYLEFADDLAKVKPPARLLVAYYEALLPPILVDVLPFAFLVAALITVAGLVRSSEATAFLASGVSLYRLAAPLLILAATAGVILFLLAERVVPRASAESAALKARLKGVAPPPVATSNGWVRGQGGRFFAVDAYDPRTRGIAGLQMIEVDPATFRVRVRAAAAHAQVLPGRGFLAEQGWIRSFTDGSDSLFLSPPGRFLLEAPEAAESLVAIQANPRQMTLAQLARFIAARRRAGGDVSELATSLHQKPATAVSVLLLTLVGLPLAFRFGRRGAVAGVGAAILLGLVYFFASGLFVKLGDTGALPPAAAAWSADVLFALGAAWGLVGVET
jgi:LPS export ABC transporter permease LptF/LPS export ABC transporter permease LptG